jgi:hypothetical protein
MFRFLIFFMFIWCSHTSAALAQNAPADNEEMTQLFTADQAIRKGFSVEKLSDPDFMAEMIAGDEERRQKTRALIEDGQLVTANDFYHAAFVFQHGGDANAYLMAHTLAMVAMAKGHPNAAWISAASLDRYLQRIGKDQIFGTQYSTFEDGTAKMSPYNKALIPDSLRELLGVPPLEQQMETLERMGGSRD